MARVPRLDAVAGASPYGEVPGRSLTLNLLLSLRPEQWTKNLIVFAGLIFGGELMSGTAVVRALAAFAAFSALSSGVYLLNDVVDRDADRRHPLKSRRPIARGLVPIRLVLAVSGVLAAAALAAAFWLQPGFGLVGLAYFVLLALYSFVLKHVVIIDVLTIAAGFVLRAVAGAVVIPVPISHWLLVCTILLALFLALAKRRHEVLAGSADDRPVLDDYSPVLLDQMIAIVAASTLVAYSLYTLSPSTIDKFHTEWLSLTIPFPLYGIFRYLYLIHRRAGGGSPAEALLGDRPLLACVALWALAVVLIIYGRAAVPGL